MCSNPQECCKPENFNLVVVEEKVLPGETYGITRQCTVCNRRHYELSVPPILIGMVGNE
jgi:hypothetical protein